MIRFVSFQSALGGVIGRVRQTLTHKPSRRERRREASTCVELIGLLEPVNRFGITRIALAFLLPSPRQMDPRSEDRLIPADIWDLAGGLGGIMIMERNAKLFVRLAEAVQEWNSEAFSVCERIRLDCMVFRRHLRRMRLAEYWPSGAVRVPFHLQSAVTVYYLMTKRLLALYEISHSGLYPRLKEML